MFGTGGTASILSCLNCNGINFDSASYDGGSMFYADFGITSHAGSTGNWAAIESILPPGGTYGVDSRDGLYFYRLRIYDFNQGFIIAATWESHINECKIFRVNNPISLGNYAMVMRITDNNIIYEGGFPTGAANRYAVELLGGVTEGAFIRGNQLFGYSTVLKVSNSVYTIFNDNDIFGSGYGIDLGTANTGMSIQNNYFEISANNAIGIYGNPYNVEISNLVLIANNVFITGSGNNTKGIVLGTSVTTYAWNYAIRNNIFVGIQNVDIEVNNGQNIIIEGNRFLSTAPTNNINISAGGSSSYNSNYIIHNKLEKGIAANSVDVDAGRIIIRENLIAGTQTFGAVWATSGKIDGNTIGSVTPAAGSFTDLKGVTKVFSGFDAASTNTGSTFEMNYVLPSLSMHIVTCYMQRDPNIQAGPGVYIVIRQGTSTTVTTITAFAGIAVSVNGSYKLEFANTTGFNGIIYASALRTVG